MKKSSTLFLAGILLFTLAACGMEAGNTESLLPSEQASISEPAAQETPSGKQELPSEAPTSSEVTIGEGKILVAYFSSSGNIVTEEEPSGNVGKGNTKTVADMIVEQVGGDLFFMETVDKYPANYNDTIDVAMQEQRANARPALATHVENMDDYDVIFLGFPNWWGTMPQAVFTFLEEYDFSGKTVIPFCTHEGSGFGRSVDDLESALPNATLLEGFSVRGSSASDATDDVIQWISELDLGI